MEIFGLFFSKNVWFIILICLGIGLILLLGKYIRKIILRRRRLKEEDYARAHGLLLEGCGFGCLGEDDQDYELYDKAQRCLDENNTEEAIKILLNLAKIFPLASDPYKLIGEIYLKLKMYEQAIQYFTEAIKITTKEKQYLLSIPIYKLKIKAYMDMGELNLARLDIEKAINDFNEYEKLDPNEKDKYDKCFGSNFKKQIFDILELLEELKEKENTNKTYKDKI